MDVPVAAAVAAPAQPAQQMWLGFAACWPSSRRRCLPSLSAFNDKVHQQVWIVSEFMNRGSLLDAIDRGLLTLPSGRPNLHAAVAAGIEMAGALSYLHSCEVIHGEACGLGPCCRCWLGLLNPETVAPLPPLATGTVRPPAKAQEVRTLAACSPPSVVPPPLPCRRRPHALQRAADQLHQGCAALGVQGEPGTGLTGCSVSWQAPVASCGRAFTAFSGRPCGPGFHALPTCCLLRPPCLRPGV